MTQEATVRASFSITKTSTPDGGSGKVEQALSFVHTLLNGTTAGKADLSFIDEARALADGATEDIDLAGSLTDPFGATITAVEIVAIVIRATSTNTTNLTIGGATAEWQAFFAAAGDKLTLRPGEWFMAFSDTGWTVGAGTTDDLKVANAAGAAATFDIGFIGRSA